MFLRAPYNFLVQHFHNLDSKDLGSYDLSMKHGRTCASSIDAGGAE